MNAKKVVLMSSLVSLLMAEILKTSLAYSLFALAIVIGIDTITGVIKAIKQRNFNSWGFSRLFRKITHLFGAIAVLLILYQATSISFLRDFIDIMVVVIILNELFSVMENMIEINENTKTLIQRFWDFVLLLKKGNEKSNEKTN